MRSSQKRALERVSGQHSAEGSESRGQGPLNRAQRRAEAARLGTVQAVLKAELRRLKPGEVAEVDLAAIYTHAPTGGRHD